MHDRLQAVFPPLNRSSLGGIPVLRRDVPGPMTGTLHFGVGTRDEPLRLLGITHLVEHLVFALAEPDVVHNAGVEADGTSFWATGTPEEVAGFLSSICRGIAALGEVSDEQVAREQKILRIEEPNACDDFAEGVLAYRYGASGLGKPHLGTPTLDAITRDDVVAWAQRWFTAANACLTFTGPIPEGLTLVLPSGEKPQRERVAPHGLPSRTVVMSRKVGVALSFVVATERPQLLLTVLKHEFHQRLRIEEGLVYSVDTWSDREDDTSADGPSWHCALALDPLPEDTAQVASIVIAMVAELVVSGPSLTAVRRAVADRRVTLGYVSGPAARHLDVLAVDLVRGRRSPTLEGEWERLQRPTEVLRDEFAVEVAAAFATVQIAVDDDVDPDEIVLGESGLSVRHATAWVDDDARLRGHVFLPRSGDDHRALRRIVVASDRVQQRDRDEMRSVVFADVVFVGQRPDGELVLLCADGRHAVVDPSEWWRGARLVDEIVGLCSGAELVALPASDG